MLDILDPIHPVLPPPKSRIYIKSVDVLRNPSFTEELPPPLPDPYVTPPPHPPNDTCLHMPTDLVDLCDLTHEDEDQLISISSTVAPAPGGQHQQKIYLKNVNELQQQSHLVSSEFDQFQAMAFQPQLSFPIPTPPPPLTPDTVPTQPTMSPDEASALEAMIFNAEQLQEQHSVEAAVPKNKIYIRNVQTLIRPDHELVSAATATTSSAYLPQSMMDIEEEEVQSLSPQRNDIVVLDDFHEEPQGEEEDQSIAEEEELSCALPIVSPSGDIIPVDDLTVSEAFKVMAESQNFTLLPDQANNHNFMGIFAQQQQQRPTDCDPADESSFYYKNLEENLPQLILQTSTLSAQNLTDSTVETMPMSNVVSLMPAKDDEDDLNTPPRVDIDDAMTDQVICLPDESDAEDLHFGQKIALPQMPRIYISNNLAEPSTVSQVVIESGTPASPPTLPSTAAEGTAKKARGRPRGGRNYGKEEGTSAFTFKCPESQCPRRFQQQANLEYHQRCHDTEDERALICCPECKSKEFTRWNALHVHLWRSHSIDMELYACTMCNFKTPCLSQLNNTHVKTHSTEKAFKCDQCPSAFKNQKQLKNHRRHHRLRSTKKENVQTAKERRGVIKCSGCDLAFRSKSLRWTHMRKEHPSLVGRVRTENSKVSELESCSKNNPSYKCDQCAYETRHRNSARRHRMMHSGEKKYKCPVCEYSCIQSNSFRVGGNCKLLVMQFSI